MVEPALDRGDGVARDELEGRAHRHGAASPDSALVRK
jgi:hypothetical protein